MSEKVQHVDMDNSLLLEELNNSNSEYSPSESVDNSDENSLFESDCSADLTNEFTEDNNEESETDEDNAIFYHNLALDAVDSDLNPIYSSQRQNIYDPACSMPRKLHAHVQISKN